MSETESNLPAVIEAEYTDLPTIKREPDIVVEEARKAAIVLQGVIGQKKNKVLFNGEQYLEFEDWALVSRFYGVAVKVERTELVHFDIGAEKPISGFEAAAVAIDASGREISRAEAMCLNDEPKWGSRPKYAWLYVCKDGSLSEEDPGKDQIIWEKYEKDGQTKSRPKKQRELIGEETVPLYQLRSMAQTRACAKVLRQLFSWVVVLAGYRPTPAEELPQDGEQRRSGDPAGHAFDTPAERRGDADNGSKGAGKSQEKKPEEKTRTIGEIVDLASEHWGPQRVGEALALWSDYENGVGERVHIETVGELDAIGIAYLRKIKMQAAKWLATGQCQHCKGEREPGSDG